MQDRHEGQDANGGGLRQGGTGRCDEAHEGLVAQGKTKGVKFTCESCHKDLNTYELTKNANADYKKLEAAIAKK